MVPKRIITTLLLLQIFFATTSITSITTAAQENIEITNFKYQLIRTQDIGNIQGRYYTFWVSFTNSGDTTTKNTTVYLEDPEINAPLEISQFTLTPQQNITVIYEEWPTTLTGEITINITYNPTEADIENNQYNSGKKQYVLTTGTQNNTNTPGFTTILFIASILLFLIIKRKKIKRR